MTSGHPDPTASERLLAKTLAKGRALRRRRTILQRAAVLGFVAAVAAGGAAGAAVATSRHAAPSPAGGGTGTSGTARTGSVPPTRYAWVRPSGTTASASTPGHPPAGAVDNDLQTFWAVGPKPGLLPGVGQSLTLHFAKPEPIAAVAFFAGDQRTAQDFTSAYRPEHVELIFSSGQPLSLTLRSTRTLQSWKFRPRTTAEVEILVTGVYAPSTGSAADPEHGICVLGDVFVYTELSGK